MSEGFTADWLSLREGYDARARNAALLARLAGWRAGRGPLHVVDLGAGTGSGLRALAPALSGPQRWTLVERDPALIGRGQAALAGCGVAWAYRCLDLALDLDRLVEEPVDLITASALIDLVSEPWLAGLLAWQHRAQAALYLALSYDGRCSWAPPLPFDEVVLALVNRHQRTDKGFGPALGPDAARRLRELSKDAEAGTSDWVLEPCDRAIQNELLTGYTQAALAIAPSRTVEVAQWAHHRRRLMAAAASRLTVGHTDLLLLPGG